MPFSKNRMEITTLKDITSFLLNHAAFEVVAKGLIITTKIMYKMTFTKPPINASVKNLRAI